ncbi:CubicO group peptidase, beta-lactamase class C family [Jatrophihabitans endophyticus]|uniref:CubicO group peptidase, beta-lactamase class C family n=1 Tax=Jatrophihabitans endophyticus TaxID=1206085 RepID=A0A1M5RL43_9ACTN|nr:serine hydrolase domain-containing protein [Jatrophihabitans endophyticus]SHH26846.1 CubicO group peptidase, beta-lactamase class C family [Jatrophihabitans endophyticus]
MTGGAGSGRSGGGSRALVGLDGWPVPTAAAAVVGPDGVLATHGRVDHEFALASVTKPLAALAVLVAVEEEAVSLDDPADADLLPGATLRHLLAHASGVAADERRRERPPGDRRVYSNAGFELAGDLVTRATGIPFADYLREAVFEPLGMRSSDLAGSPAHAGRSTVADLAHVVSELLAPSGLLGAATLTALREVQFPGLRGVLPGYGGQSPNDWGLGFELRGDKSPHWTGSHNSPATYGHFGQRGTMFWVDPEAGLALVALADRDFGDWARAAWPALADAVLAEFG